MFTASLNLEGLQSMFPKDPVCGLTVAIEKAAGMSVHRGTTYYFCSAACKQQFEADPEKFVAKAAKT